MRNPRPATFACVAMVSIVLLFGACGGGSSGSSKSTDATRSTAATEESSAAKPGGTIRIAATEPDALDPALIDETLGFSISRLLYMPLVDYDADMKVIPGVAKSWDVSDDRLTYTFHLRTDIKFTNGRTVTAEDFAYAARRFIDPDLASPSAPSEPIVGWNEAKASALSGVVGDVDLPGVQATAPDTLVIKVNAPYSLLLDDLTLLWPIPSEAVDTEAKAKAYGDQPVGDGPYKMAEPWQHNAGINLVRNESFAGKAGVADRLEFKIFADDVAPYRELQAGNLDIASPPLSQIAEARQEFGKRFIQSPSSFVYYIAFPLKKAPWDNLDLRRALSMAIDREAVTTRLLEGAAVPADRFVPAPFPGAAKKACPSVVYNPTAAKKAFKDSGGVPNNTITAYYPSGLGFDEVAKAAANNIHEVLGVTLNFEQIELSAYTQMLHGDQDGPFGSGWASSVPSAYGFIQSMFETGAPGNFGNFSDPKYDALMADVRNADDPAAANALMEKAQARLCDEMPVVPLAFPGLLTVHSERVDHIVIDSIGTPRYEDAAVVKS